MRFGVVPMVVGGVLLVGALVYIGSAGSRLSGVVQDGARGASGGSGRGGDKTGECCSSVCVSAIASRRV